MTAAGAALSLAAPAAAENDPVAVRGGNGWIESEVVDVGSSRDKKVRKRPEPTAATSPTRTCAQSRSDNAGGYASQEQFDSGAPPGEGPGGWVVRRCSDGSMETAWVPVGPLGSGPVTPEQLAQRATNRLRLPLPEPQFEPRRSSSAGPATLVAIPTWFYLDGFEPVSQRTEAGAVWAMVSAEPVETLWWPGDGSDPVRCAGAGRPWSATGTSATPCLYTYTRSSAAQPGNVYIARVTVTWRVSWRGSGGLGGTLPLMERQTTFPVAVAERQTVVVGGGSS
ncbi:MAG: hypothetical protein ACT4P1_10685 [Sporichthyaceae bacterium]